MLVSENETDISRDRSQQKQKPAMSIPDGMRRFNRREQKRNEGRFMVQSRLANKLRYSSEGRTFNNGEDCQMSFVDEEILQNAYKLLPFVNAIKMNNKAAFGIHKMAMLADNIDTCIPLHEMSFCCGGQTKTFFDFGNQAKVSVEGIGTYQSRLDFIRWECERFGGLTLLTLASLYGRVKIICQLLKCGADPTVRGNIKNLSADKELISFNVLKCISDEMFPVLYAGWALKIVNEMRYNSYLRLKSVGLSKPLKCKICDVLFDLEQIFQWNCQDIDSKGSGYRDDYFCENCWWKSWLENVHRNEVLVCPLSSRPWLLDINYDFNDEFDIDIDLSMISKAECNNRQQNCLSRFKSLPPSTSDLKKLPKKQLKGKGEVFCKSWREIINLSIGNTQDVRSDKFLSAVSRGSFRFVRGCLEGGVNIDGKNEYGQTALFIAAWKGHDLIVKVMLWYGASLWEDANGGLQALLAARCSGNVEVFNLLSAIWDKECRPRVLNSILSQERSFHMELPSTTFPRIQVLIEKNLDHPGRGSIMIDNAIPESLLHKLIQLSDLLPSDTGKHELKYGSDGERRLCSTRSYYCDVEGIIVNAIKKNIPPELCGGSVNDRVNVFPTMRFLNYNHPGTSLAKHVDLCRLDENGRRSSHSFLLYLCDCNEGGETILLESLSSNQVVAKVRPKRGRLLVFPHECPHEGSIVVDTPKLLIRGEVIFSRSHD